MCIHVAPILTINHINSPYPCLDVDSYLPKWLSDTLRRFQISNQLVDLTWRKGDSSRCDVLARVTIKE